MRHSKSKSVPRHRPNSRSIVTLKPVWTPPVSNPVAVVGVSVVSATVLRWTFSAPITAAPTSAPALQASSDGSEFSSPTSTVQDGVATLRTIYAGTTFDRSGGWYQLSAIPGGLNFATGTLAVPQAGKATNPLTLTARRARKGRAAAAQAKRKTAKRPAIAGRIGKPARKAA